jgi:RNA polymerase sigma-70 factor (sigma-E family)
MEAFLGVRMAERDGVTFDEVFAAERAPLTRLVYLLVDSPAVAEDVVQEAFVRLYERFAGITNPAGFVRTVAVRLAIDWQRRRRTERAHLTAVRAPDDEPSGEPEHDEAFETLRRLRPERRLVLVLRFYEDMSHEQIARVVGASAATVRSRVRRGLADLRREMDR